MYYPEDIEYLENHPLVFFIDAPIVMIPISNSKTIRTITVDTQRTTIDIVARLQNESNIKNRIFVIYRQNEDSYFWDMGINPYDFRRDVFIRMAEIQIEKDEWNFLMKNEIKEREKKYLEILNENKYNNYKYLLLR
jgi:hypothetical protein